LQEFISGTGRILLYFLIMAGAALSLRALITVPDEPFRKLLHCILLGSLAVWLFAFETWWIAAILVIIFIVAVYPALMLAEHIKGYSRFVTERKSGELKSSLVVVFSMFLIVMAVLLMPGTVLSYYLDMIGSAVVAVYLVFCGIKTLRDSKI